MCVVYHWAPFAEICSPTSLFSFPNSFALCDHNVESDAIYSLSCLGGQLVKSLKSFIVPKVLGWRGGRVDTLNRQISQKKQVCLLKKVEKARSVHTGLCWCVDSWLFSLSLSQCSIFVLFLHILEILVLDPSFLIVSPLYSNLPHNIFIPKRPFSPDRNIFEHICSKINGDLN